MNIIQHNGVPCVEAIVHMMATKESSQITMHELDGLKFSKSYWLNTSTQENQHIYITTGEEIKDGDEFWYNNGGEWFRAIYRDYYKAYFPYGRKIIATTDNSLHLPYVLPGEEDLDVYRYEISPEIQERFIEEFCKAGGIDKVMVEMQSKCSKLGFECSAKIYTKNRLQQLYYNSSCRGEGV
jgi:hypothetical protein